MKKAIFVFSLCVLLCFGGCQHKSNDNSSQSESNSGVSSVSQNTSTEGLTDDFIDSCNSFAGGYVAYLNGQYYYADISDNNKLYMYDSQSNNSVCIDELPNDAMPNLKTNGNDVFYLRSTVLDTPIDIGELEINFQKTLCVYKDENSVALSQDNIISYDVCGEYIFYVAVDMNVYRMRLDGSDKTSIFELNYPMHITVSGEVLYLNMGETLITMNYQGQNSKVYNLPHLQFAANGQSIYYTHSDSLNLIVTDDFGLNESTLIEEEINSFTVYKNKIVYQLFGEEKIYAADLDGSNRTLLCEGEQPLIVNGHLLCIANGEIVSIDAGV